MTEVITIRGFINVDFADVKTVMSGRGKAMMGSGVASGENRAEEAVQKALTSPLLDNIDLHGASGVLVNITAGSDLSSKEFEVIGAKINEIAGDDATIITGCIKEEDNLGELRVTLIATGFDDMQANDANLANPEADDNKNDIGILGNIRPNNIPNIPLTGNENQSDSFSTMNNEHLVDNEQRESIDIPAFLRQQAD